MWRYLPLALLALVAYVNGACTDIANCDSCVNPPLKCYTCNSNQVLNKDASACLNCPSNCLTCTATDDEVSCNVCSKGYVLEKDGTCTDCGTGCADCHYDSKADDAKIICDSCKMHNVQDKASKTGECIECGSNCKTCSLLEDGSTQCSACYGVLETGSKSYFLTTEDKTCKACPSNCDVCSDNGNGKGICKSCKTGYEVQEDADDAENDGTKCLKCPTDCTSCSGLPNSGAATCTACKENLGLYVDSGDCSYCESDVAEEAAKSCDEEGTPTECHESFRLDSSSCVACPAFCLTCSVDESSGDDICDSCSAGYGTKLISSLTCDSCPSNCATCTIDSEGVSTCTTCKTGYAKNGDGKCTACASGCATCSWSSTFMSCDTCLAGYSDTPLTPDGGAETSSNIGVCEGCPSNCNNCVDGNNCTDSSVNCDTGFVVVQDSNLNFECLAITANCATAADDGSTDCTTCDDVYYADNSTGGCTACPSGLNCKTCDVGANDACDSCSDGYAFVDTDADNITDACESCGISNCLSCHAIGDEAGATKKCFSCATGYIRYDTDSNTGNGYEQCKKCPTGCDTCTIDTGDNDKTKCTNGGCASWDLKKAYANGDDGACVVCPSQCMACTFDSSEEKTICTDGQCDTGYAKNADSGLCEVCPDNCDACEWDSSDSSIVCSSGGCETEYGLTLEGECDACPNNCDSCTFDETLELLICDTCTSGYRSNEDVCGACPSNCKICSDNSASMTCSECKAGYALRSSDKVCVKCPSQCKVCDAKATSVTCKECNYGYSIAGDKKSCSSCSDAAFNNCETCGTSNATTDIAECFNCTSGFLLKDDASECLDLSSFDCAGGQEDRPAECTSCAATYVATPDLNLCVHNCIVCGDIGAGTFVEQSACNINGNGTVVYEACATGTCFGKYKNLAGKQMVAAGCIQEACSTDALQGETCQTSGGVEVCSRCCKSDKCNDFVATMDGVPDSAGVPAISAFLLVLASFVSLYL